MRDWSRCGYQRNTEQSKLRFKSIVVVGSRRHFWVQHAEQTTQAVVAQTELITKVLWGNLENGVG